MKLEPKNPPRKFAVGKGQTIMISDMGSINLSADEQVTFISDDAREYDVVRKEWGYYATPSVNDRLKRFGYKTAMVKNAKGQGFVMLVDEDKVGVFSTYLKAEDNVLVAWLDEGFDLGDGANIGVVDKGFICPVCKSSSVNELATFDTKPKDENDFQLSPYKRVLKECENCHHYFNVHDYDIESFYSGHYADSVYQDKMGEKFEKIINLPDGKSDNRARVTRVQALMNAQDVDADDKETRVLDIGSGLCVFLYELARQTNWQCFALDPDEKQAAHARERCKVNTVTTGVMEYEPRKAYDLVTLNKVLEHFETPEDLLMKMRTFLPENKDGYVYIEVPDAEKAAGEGFEREEFFIEHFHAFSFESFFTILKKCGYTPIQFSRIQEPSGKFTLYCLASARQS